MLGLTILGLIISLLTNGVSADNLENVKVYSDTMCVVNVDYETDIVTIADFNGFEFEFEGCEDWFEGDLCSVTMCDNGTPIIFDDIILDTRYSGWVYEWGYDHETKGSLYYFDFD